MSANGPFPMFGDDTVRHPLVTETALPQAVQEVIERLERTERERLAEAYKIPYSTSGQIASNSYLKALADVRDGLRALEGRAQAPAPDEKMRVALESIAQMGDDIKEMARDFIATRDRRSLENYAGNIASIARAALPAPPSTGAAKPQEKP